MLAELLRKAGRDLGCYMKELIFRLTVDMGEAGNSPDRYQSGKKSRDLGYAS